ncbi:hypothetical protein ZOSMA_221G00080 [Zostera marina]|uniref:Uncharacterized protein n=1 Tax=Zostera marina TaxID=29655 RepID=A0A0K9PLL1_ZOSMR|nr:hypothetical protein ZOSMA_221G00080 [Zostera marina]
MKASLKFLDSTDEPTRVEARVKIPISILGFPLSTGVNTVAGDTKSFRLDVSTAFESFPTLRFSYRPNDVVNPFSFVVKSGIGAFGSPIGAPMSMSAEFTLPRRDHVPAFFLHFRPRIGDFSITKTTASVPSSSSSTVTSASPIGIVENKEAEGGESYFKVKGFPPVKSIGEIHSGFEFLARSVLPVKNTAEVIFRWGVKIPNRFNPGSLFNDDDYRVVDLGKQPASIISGMDFPVLVMKKITIKPPTPWKNEEERKKEVEELRSEYEDLRKTVEEIHAEFDRLRKFGDGRKASIVGAEEEPKNKKQN